MMDPINLELRLVTPAYTGGADTEVADGLRPPTLKALLRFWWRAMHPELKPQELFAREEALFGSTSAGQRLSIIPVGPINTMSECPARYTTDVKPPLFYLAYGTQGDRQSNPRPRAKADTTYRYRLILSPAMTVEDRSEIFKALWLLGAIGGCGTRSRRGFGSLEIVSASLDLPHRPAADTQAALVTWLKSGVERICTPVFDGLPEHTAFSKRARLVCGPERGTWEDALIAAGSVYYKLRRLLGTTFNHGNLGQPVGMDFLRTSTYGKPNGRPGQTGSKATLGAEFGLPQNYQFSGPHPGAIGTRKWKPSYEAECRGEQARRASPVFMHVTRLSTNKYVPLVIWLPAIFLPDDGKVKFRDGRNAWSLIMPGDTAVSWLFDGTTQLRQWISRAEQPAAQFTGYLGTPGWKKVL